jgi:hypothetical protein
MIIRFASLTCSVLLICQSAFADEPAYKRHRYRHYVPAAPHVVELVAPPYSGRFVINGFRYDNNVSTRTTCQTSCRGRAWW